jgi:two-component system sensor histidine kinase LytS
MIFFVVKSSLLFRMKKNLILCFSFFLIHTTYSQEFNFQEVATYKEFSSFKIKEITQDKFNNIYFSTSKGLLKFDGISITLVNFNGNKQSQKVTTVLADNDSLFIGKNKSLQIQTHNKVFTFEANSINKIYHCKQGYFLGTNQGILYFKNNKLQPLATNYDLDFSIINDIIYYENKFLVASNSGLWMLSDLLQPKKTVLIGKGNYSSFLQVDKKLYVVKNNSKIEELTTTNQLIEKYAKPSIHNISNIHNKIYVTSKSEGIDVLNLISFIFEKRINKYNSFLKSNEITAIFEDAEENIFIATEEVLYIKKKDNGKAKASLKIAALEVNYKLVDAINPNSYNTTLQLKPNQNNLSFLLQNVSIRNPKNIEFRYKLNANFSLWNTNKQINFASLKPGQYEFIVESRFKGQAKISSKKFSFYIENHFYEKGWFLLVCGVLFSLCLTIIITRYIKQLQTRNKQKIAALKLESHLLSLEQKALQLQMNPHFIFNVLNGIKALGNADDKEALNRTITEFSVLLRSILKNSRLEEISLKEELETLENYLSLEQKMSSKKFEFSFEKDLNNMDAEELLIPPMLLQPFIENSIKHGISKIASKGKISIHFKVKYQFLECTILDNGIGVFQSQKGNTAKNHASVALKITKERIENLSKLNAFYIEEIHKENVISGTKVWFKIPLKTDY